MENHEGNDKQTNCLNSSVVNFGTKNSMYTYFHRYCTNWSIGNWPFKLQSHFFLEGFKYLIANVSFVIYFCTMNLNLLIPINKIPMEVVAVDVFIFNIYR